MIVTAKDLRFKISMLFDVLSKGEEVLITYRGEARARLTPYDASTSEEKSDEIFGLWSDSEEDVDAMVRGVRQGRHFDL